MIMPSTNESEDGISNFLRWAWEWKFTLLTPTLISVFLAITSFTYVPPQYTSQAVLIMDVRQRQVLPGESFISPLIKDNPVIKTELDIISSRNTAAYVVDLLSDRGIEVTPPSEKVSPFVLLGRAIGDIIGASTASAQPIGQMPSKTRLTAESDRSKIDDLLAGLRVSNDGRSYTMFIEYVSPDRVFAAEAANAFADAYLHKQLEIYNDAAAKARDFLGPRVESLRAQLEQAELNRQDRRQKAGLTPAGDGTLLVQRLADLSKELAAVRAAVAEARARLETARNSSPAAGTSVDSPQIQALVVEKSNLERERANLIQHGALRSQTLVEIERSLNAVDEKMNEEFLRILGRFEQEIVVQERKKTIIEAEIERMRDALERNAGFVIEVAQLDREVEASSAIYESYLSRYKETIEQDGIAVPDARLISAAEPGVRDGAGRLAKWLMASVVIGASVGGVGALGRSAIDAKKASPEGVVAETGAAVLGFIPRLSAAKLRQSSAAWSSAFSLIQMNSMLPLKNKACSVVAITSLAKGDGKTTVSNGLAQALATSGVRSLLVDCCTREPQISPSHRVSGQKASVKSNADAPMLTPENLKKTPWNDDVLRLGNTDAPVSFSVQIRQIKAVIQEAREKYDVVILDCPAMGDHPETTHLAALSDLAIQVVRWPRSRMSDVRTALAQLATIVPEQRVGTVFVGLDHDNHPFRVMNGNTGQLAEV
ncbi:GumC family protein [Sulfitobacter sabulilitoris]|uniref:AAA domain-containing protein n=1 Tax=Sulfitobacter sabulilitoris TaxID=2562655 RepID=A0A5S3P7W9_9RHOB|nr:exopolysaccharide transport family protein [Sulfitobacter sabulilitoris]TMM49548.1 hypothetical protein FDT80_17505 [Sulfitobacter sabulilitoris]